ncbi:hypothetical protein B0H11DRAFT_1918429 [Mycena galericulata]|nr:hypothetical protein B0H11DRAFT_1918429 [Mycena galericulata]
MLFSNTLLLSASFAALIVPGVLAIPSPRLFIHYKIHFLIRISAHQANVNVGARTDGAVALISQTSDIVNQIEQLSSTMDAIAKTNPSNPAIQTTVNQVTAMCNILTTPDSGVIPQCINGDPNALSGLGASDPLGGVLALPTPELLQSVLGGGLDLSGLLGGLLGGLNLGSPNLCDLIAQLLDGLSSLQAGGCPTDLLATVVGLVQGIVAGLLGLLSTGTSCGCGSDPQLLATITGLLGGL